MDAADCFGNVHRLSDWIRTQKQGKKRGNADTCDCLYGSCPYDGSLKVWIWDTPDYDASRVAAQIVSGVGFLGAGMIFVRNNSVSGLTTAAGIWTTAGVGMAMGAGAYFIGICSGILVLFTQILLHRTSFLAAEPYRSYLKVTTSDYEKVMADLREQFKKDKIREVGVKVTKNKSKGEIKIELDLFFPAKYEKSRLIYRLAENEDILAVSG